MNDKINAQLELLKYIQEKMRHKLEEIDLYLRDVDTTITEIECLVNGDKYKGKLSDEL